MRIRTIACLLLLSVSFWGGGRLYAQDGSEASEAVGQSATYLDSRISSLNKYLERSSRIEQKLLKKLSRKEDRMLRTLAAKDSALYRDYLERSPSFDSIASLGNDTTFLAKNSKRKNTLIDSLKGVQSFMSAQARKLGAAGTMADKAGPGEYTQKLESLQQKLNAEQQIKDLIKQRTSSLEGMANANNLPGLKGVQKEVYYAQEKIKNWKQLADEPEDAEEQALEYLQGTEGFDRFMKKGSGTNGGPGNGGPGNDATEADLQRMGYQTKKQVGDMLQKKLGDNLGSVQQQMAKQVQEYTDKLGGIGDKVKEAKEGINNAKQTLQEAKNAKEQIKNIEKPGFKKNPERGKPFWQRLEPQYNFQTTRPTTGGLRPAMLELGAGVAFKHSPKLSYGMGIGLSAGLGQNWQHIKLSYEGISARIYADWQWQYGVSVQAGYEQTFRPAGRAYLPENDDIGNNYNSNNPEGDNSTIKEAFGGQQRTAYIGLMKRYRINSNWNGTFLAGYNFLWREEGLRTPFMLRLGWTK